MTRRSAGLFVIAAMLVALVARAQAPPAIPPDLDLMGPPASVPPPTGPREGVEHRRVETGVARDASRGTRALLDGRPAEAMQAYDRAQVRAPDVAELAYNRGLAALLAGNTEEAQAAFQLAQELREKEAEARPQAAPPAALAEDSRFNDGHAAWQKDDVRSAVQRWASVVARDPNAPDARKNLELALRLMQSEQEQQQQQQQQPPPEPQEEQPQEQQPQPQEPQDQPQQPEEQQDQEQAPQQPQERPGSMSRDQAEQLLDALESSEKQAMEEKQKEAARRGRPPSGKVW